MPMPPRLALSALALAALLAPACLGTGSSVNAYGGARSLESDGFDDLDEPTVYGADVVLKLELPLLAVEGGWFRSEDDASSSGTLVDPDLTLDEYFVGLRLTPWKILVEPYGSAGVIYVDSELDDSVGSDSDSSLAYYARLGAALRFGFVRFGLDGRAVFGSEVDLDAIESDIDGYQLAAFIGFAF
jgi:hypothetical protein